MPLPAANLEARLAAILTPDRVSGEAGELARYAIDEILPAAVAKPGSAEETAEIVRFAAAQGLAIIPSGHRSKLAIGRPPTRYDIALDMSALKQIAHYDPDDLTLSVDAGCTLLSIATALAPQKQFLPLTVAFGAHATVAGTIASGVDSHLRQQYGTARDFLVGAEFIDGAGAQCKSGGRVVKNVTGYDLHKLLIGSLGTLGIITRLNFRTFPALGAGEAGGTFIASFADAQSAVAFRQQIAASPFTPHTVEILSPGLARIFAASNPRNWEPPAEPLGDWFSTSRWHLVAMFQGTPDLCQRYVAAFTAFAHDANALLARSSPTGPRDGASEFATEWRTLAVCVASAVQRLRNVTPAATIFKIAQLPAKLPALFDALATAAGQAQIPHALLARGLGITYFALLPKDPPDHLASAHEPTITQVSTACHAIFSACAAQSATATILFAPAALKRRISLPAPERPDAAAMRRLKSAFDPQNIFSPGREPL
ncbi:MAG: FAD-binding oxidoreductase [Candidatus Acidiferrum sp.]|jgi:glycolate oxidase FAD binding subunit